MADWLGALIGAAERTVTRLAAHKRPKRNPILEVVKQARQAGIHPLVALQGGFGGQPLYGSGVDWSQPLGFGEAIGGLGDQLMQDYRDQQDSADYDRRRAEDRMFEREMNSSRLQNTPQDDYYRAMTDNVRKQTELMELDHALKGATIGGNVTPTVGAVEFPETRQGLVTPTGDFLWPGLASDAQAYENRWGDSGPSTIMNWLIYLSDAINTTNRLAPGVMDYPATGPSWLPARPGDPPSQTKMKY